MKFDPPAGLKSKIAADFDAISAKRRRRRFIFWFTSGVGIILLLAGIWGSYLYLDQDNSNGLSQDSALNSLSKATSEPLASEHAGLISTSYTDGKAKFSDATYKKIGSTETFKPESDFIQEKVTEKVIVNPSTAANAQVVSRKTKRNSKDKASVVASQIAVTVKSTIDQVGSLSIAFDDKNLDDKTSLTNTVSDGFSKNQFAGSIDKFEIRAVFQTMPMLNLHLKNEPWLTDGNRAMNKQIGFSSFEKGQNCLRPLISAGGGYGLSYRVLRSDAHADVVEHKNQNEHFAASYSGQIAASFPIYKSYSIKGGFQFLRLAEAYHFETSTVAHQTVNTYQYMNADLKVSKNLFCDGKFRVDLSAGARMAMLLNAQSSWLSPTDHSPVLHSSSDHENPFNKYTLSWNLELAAYYTIKKDWFVGLSAEGDYFQNSIYIKQTGLVQKPYFFQGSVVFGRYF
ncbi:MAG: hypothetical protein NWS53_13365 [Salibacteraceae bacterium]|nr:hypothetical protein [Salibacteraceae bacterium]